MDDNNKNVLKEEKGKDLSSQLDKLLGALNFSRKEIGSKKRAEEEKITAKKDEEPKFDGSETQEIPLHSESETMENEKFEIDMLFRDSEEGKINSFSTPETANKKSFEEHGELDGLFSIREDADKIAELPKNSPETLLSHERDHAEQSTMIGFDEEVDIDQIKTSLETFSNGREDLDLHRVGETIESSWSDPRTFETVETAQESDFYTEQSKARLTNEDIEVRNGIVLNQDVTIASEEPDLIQREDPFIGMEHGGMRESGFADRVADDSFAKDHEMERREEREYMDENRIRREGYRSLEQQIKKEMGADIEKLKNSGYKPQGFVFDEGVNSKTIPEVAKIVEVTSDGRIDYDKIVGGNRLLKIDSIYDFHKLIRQMSDTVFMIELYSRTMPPNIPNEVKRESVLNIIKASSIQIEDLLQDAYQRIDVLNEVLEDVAQKAEELDRQNEDEIKQLEEQIQELKLKMQKRADFKQSQNAMIGYEIQRIVNIIEFIEP